MMCSVVGTDRSWLNWRWENDWKELIGCGKRVRDGIESSSCEKTNGIQQEFN